MLWSHIYAYCARFHVTICIAVASEFLQRVHIFDENFLLHLMKSNGKFALLKCMKMYEVIKTSLHRMHLIEIVNVNSLFCLSCHFFFCCWFCYLSHFSSIEHVRNTFFSFSQNKNEKYITLIMFVSIHLMLCMFCKWTQYEPYSSNARNAIESSLLARAHTHTVRSREIYQISLCNVSMEEKSILLWDFP